MLQFLTENNTQITLVIAIIAGVFAFVKWLDSRNQSLRDKRFENYMKLMRMISGVSPNGDGSVGITEQIAAIWFLLEYKEYHDITLKILDNSGFEGNANGLVKQLVLPQIKLLVEEIKKRE